MAPLATELRNRLERVIVEARRAAEAGAKAALEAVAVHHHEPYPHMDAEARQLRNCLRARARQLGDGQDRSGRLEIAQLMHECAYEHWHRMLFARFLAENHMLIEPESRSPSVWRKRGVGQGGRRGYVDLRQPLRPAHAAPDFPPLMISCYASTSPVSITSNSKRC